ncbi:hypothetical protein KDH83_30280, partial [Achromobacter sp. Marseille-Q0513]|nr:hypothetical protein [Achromobacter sp. Marseille-Q0513]
TQSAGTLQHAGTSLAGKDMTLSATGQDAPGGASSSVGLDLAGGTLSAANRLTLTSAKDMDTSHATLHGSGLDLSAANLRNQGGKLTSSGDATIKLGGELDNTGGMIAAAGKARVDTTRLGNRDGTVAGGNLTIITSGAIDNQRGLLQADDTLTLTAASLDNRNTLTSSGAPAKGVLGKVASIVAGRVNNQGGAISVGQDLAIKAGELDNTAGEVASQGAARIEADTLKNTQGKLLAGRTLSVIVKTLRELGTLQSQGDLSFAYDGPLNQRGDLIAGRDLSLAVGGTMDNTARINAGRDLNIWADTLNNQATGELVAGRNNTINVAGTLTNAGLIDGGNTRITAGGVTNLGRIYGDGVAIGAGTLLNGAGANGGAVIASRGSLDLGAVTLVNNGHALIYSAVDLRIGGALDASGRAVGQAQSLQNAAATIEAAGNANISAAAILNLNINYASQTVLVSSELKRYYREANNNGNPAGAMLDRDSFWVCYENGPQCSQDPRWATGGRDRLLVVPSDKYPASRYGPPFDYVPPRWEGDGSSKPNEATAPVAPTYITPDYVCNGPGGDAGEGTCSYTAERFLYARDSRIWSVFDVAPPAGPMPVWVERQYPCGADWQCQASEVARRKVYDEAYAAFKATHMQLDARIRDFNADFARRLRHNFVYYDVTETVTETRATASDPGRILSGGAMTLTGTVTNDKSQIAAGGALSVVGPGIDNIGAAGTRTVARAGSMTLSTEGNGRRRETTGRYQETLASQPIEVPVGTSGGNIQVTLSGGAPGVTGVAAPGPVRVASVGLPDGNAVRTVSNPASIPDSQLFAVNSRPGAPYIVATDPRFTGQRPYVSSDYLLDLLLRPGALPGTPNGNAAGAGNG